MDEKSLYAHILNLTASWQVKALSLDEKGRFCYRYCWYR
ncbi:transposase, ISL3 family [Klebsiella pneumoniae]|nr:transposase, ISL3 family [Klebsiella pneumoniae]